MWLENTCASNKKPVSHVRTSMQSITTTASLELVSIHFMHLDRSAGGYEYIFVVVGHFTRFVQAYPIQNSGGKTI